MRNGYEDKPKTKTSFPFSLTFQVSYLLIFKGISSHHSFGLKVGIAMSRYLHFMMIQNPSKAIIFNYCLYGPLGDTPSTDRMMDTIELLFYP